MNTLEKLQELDQYYRINRAVGHTTTMLKGVLNTSDCVVLVHSPQMGKTLNSAAYSPNGTKVNVVSINSASGLRGLNKPLVIDNCAFHALIMDSIEEIKKLKTENDELKGKIKQIKRILE